LEVPGVGDATRKDYATNYAVANGDSHKVAIGKLDLKFGGFGIGHAHTGGDGDGDQISALTLTDFNPLRAAFQEFTLSAVSGLTFDISTAMAGKDPGGDQSTEGVITTPPYNNAYLIDGTDQTFIEDAGGQIVYGRITEAAGVWTLSFYTYESGVETAYNLPLTASVKVIFREVFNAATYPTIPSDPGQFGTLDLTADVVDASAVQRGVVSTGTQSFAGLKTLLNGLVNQGIFRGDIQSDGTSTGANQTVTAPTKMILKVTNAGLTSIAGFTALSTADIFFLINGTGADITIKNNFATATTDIQVSNNFDFTMKDKTGVLLMRDFGSNRWLLIGGSGAPLSLTAFGSTPNANGLSYNSTTGVLNMQPANESFPGGLSTLRQNLSGYKDFQTGLSLAYAASAITGANQSIPSTAPIIGLTNAGLTSVNNFVAPGQSPEVSAVRVLFNFTGVDVTIKHNTGGTAANRFYCPGAVDFTFTAGSTIIVVYDTVNSLNRIMSGGGSGTGGGSAAVSTVSTTSALAEITASPRRLILVDATAGNIVITMPPGTATTVGTEYQFKRIDNTANTVTINAAGTDTIDEGSQTLAYQYSRINLSGLTSILWGAI
jgi:hypothetical protein